MSLLGLVVLIAVLTPVLICNRRYVEKLLEVGVTIAVAAAAAFAIDYPYIATEQRTETVFSFSTVTALALMLAIGLVGIRLLLHFNPKFNLKWKWVRLGVIGLEVLIAIGAFFYFRFACDPADSTGFVKDLSELARFKLSDSAGHHRIGIWRHSLLMAKRNLWFGTGCGTFAETFRDFAKEMGYLRYINRNLDFAHNEYVHILCTMGVVGVIGYVGFLLATAWRTVRFMYRNPKILLLGSCVFGYSVWVFFCFSIPIVTPIFWVLLGMLMAEIRKTSKECKKELVVAEEKPQEEPHPTEEVAVPIEG